jgi:hypothetical protein
MSEHVHTIRDYEDAEGKWRWAIAVTPGTPAGTEPDVVADSGQGYANREDMLKSFFGIFFGTFDETFLALYGEWMPPEVPGFQAAVVDGNGQPLSDDSSQSQA